MAGGVTVTEAAHGPSHMAPMAAQWSTAIATGTNAPQTTIRTSTTTPRMNRMAHLS
jgi:hypothetical protein